MLMINKNKNTQQNFLSINRLWAQLHANESLLLPVFEPFCLLTEIQSFNYCILYSMANNDEWHQKFMGRSNENYAMWQPLTGDYAQVERILG